LCNAVSERVGDLDAILMRRADNEERLDRGRVSHSSSVRDGARATGPDDARGDPLVLVVDAEHSMRRFLRVSLEARGFGLVEAATPHDGLLAVITHDPDVVLLDLGLPRGSGVELTRQIRGVSRVPIIVVSVPGQETNKIAALDAGADDYLGKPFGVRDLLARMRAALRHEVRHRRASPQVVVVGDLRIDLVRGEVTVGGAHVHLTPTEYRLLALLARNVGRVLRRGQILDEVRDCDEPYQAHHVSMLVAELRRKIEREAARPRLLLSEPGVGYRLLDRTEDREITCP
jgi:two-component system KDP operon response regulator KdpE